MAKRLFLILFFLIVALLAYYWWPEATLPKDAKVGKLVVYKAERKMEAWSGDTLLKTYAISLGGNPTGHKQVQGDSRTPEGLYYINDRNPNSGYHLNLGISYPNKADRKRPGNPGGDIKIHGLKNGQGWIGKFHRWADWTDGCIAVTDDEVEELYQHVPNGAPILIKP